MARIASMRYRLTVNSVPSEPRLRDVLLACCSAHAMQDGLVALQFVLLPILAQIFNLTYAQVGLLRGLSAAIMSAMEVPSGMLAERTGERILLAFGLLAAGVGYLTVAFASGFGVIAIGFAVAGLGAGFQHSLSSAVLVNHLNGKQSRRALGTYNAAGDAGKLTFTGLFSAALGAGFAWDAVLAALAVITALSAALVAYWLRATQISAGHVNSSTAPQTTGRWGILHAGRFTAFGVIVFVDSTIQAMFLTFLAFILISKGAAPEVATGAVVLALVGGMVGKFACGFLAARLGDRATFVTMQMLTLAGFGMLAFAPVALTLLALPVIGLAVQGSSTVTYGAVGEFVDKRRRARGYALVYTLANGASVSGPFAFGLVADSAGFDVAMMMMAALVAVTLLPITVLSARRSSAEMAARER